jgi:hypothetical protein
MHSRGCCRAGALSFTGAPGGYGYGRDALPFRLRLLVSSFAYLLRLRLHFASCTLCVMYVLVHTLPFVPCLRLHLHC